MPDMVNNVSLAADGFPTMAVTACFAGPLFTLLAGLSSALIVGTIKHHGSLPITMDTGLKIMYAGYQYLMVGSLFV